VGELIVAFLLVTLVVGGGAWAVTATGRRRSIERRPAPMLGVHDEAALAERAALLYRLGQRAVRLLERLDADGALLLSTRDRAEIQAIVEEFYGA
jgi:hypothetical protein